MSSSSPSKFLSTYFYRSLLYRPNNNRGSYWPNCQPQLRGMKAVLVGGPLVGERSVTTSALAASFSSKRRDAPAPPSWRTFEPLVSDAIDNPASGKAERFVFLPNRRFISVLAYKTGKRIATLVFNLDDEKVAPELTSVAMATVREAPVLLAGCNDGTVREFYVKDLQNPIETSMKNVGPYNIPGACLAPRRSIRMAHSAIWHLGVATLSSTKSERTIIYALVENALEDSVTASQGLSMVRGALPSFEASKQQISLLRGGNDDSPLCCVDENVKVHQEKQEEPFCLKVATCSNTLSSVFVVLGFKHALLIYHETIRSDELATVSLQDAITTFPPVRVDMPQSNPLSTIAISPNNQDIACGHFSGSVQVMTALLVRVEEYCRARVLFEAQQGATTDTTTRSLSVGKKPKHPARGLIVRKLHWHAHPVATLAYGGATQGAEPMLYSGGDESVLVTWQLSRGISKPVEVLPRIALGGIVQMTTVCHSGEPDSMLMFCADNSLSLFETHNQCRRWKVQGLAAGSGPAIFTTRPRVIADPRDPGSPSPHLLMTGLSQAPGHIQTFDPRSQRVVSSLEVAPYNRVSRTEPGDSPMPTPTISRCSWNKDGSVLLTIDVAPTENQSVGASEKLANNGVVGSITTIRFWASENKEKNPKSEYILVAAMTSPHGSENHVSAVALSSDGNYACTVSNDEKTFRLWRRVIVPDEQDSATKSAEWVCRYRVGIPAGFSNFSTGSSAVSFSEDGSLLAIAFGNLITLWDHHKVTLLTTLTNFGDSSAGFESLQFLSSIEMKDVLLVSSSRGVALQSPYGINAPMGVGWVWEIPRDEENTRITAVEFIASTNAVSIVLFDEGNSKSRIVTVDAVSGERLDEHAAFLNIEVGDEIVGIAGSKRSLEAFRLDDDVDQAKRRQTLYALTRNGELIWLCDDQVDTTLEHQANAEVGATPVTKLPDDIGRRIVRKRPTSILTTSDLEDAPPRKKVSLEHFGGFIGEESVDTSLPLLTGSFARSFVGRYLQREGQ